LAAPGPRRAPRIRIFLTDGRGRPITVRGLAAWLARLAPARRGELTVAVASDALVRRLNRTYRGVDRATDVLSFPSGTQPYLGDVVIARGIARRQARAAGHPLSAELRLLALHGMLHLLGFDHELDRGRMARVERRLRRQGGLREGLIERGGGR
jgi:probable rRNA maturation factor